MNSGNTELRARLGEDPVNLKSSVFVFVFGFVFVPVWFCVFVVLFLLYFLVSGLSFVRVCFLCAYLCFCCWWFVCVALFLLQINRRPAEYWGRVMEVARLNNLSRVQRCGQIMGRADAGEMSSAQIFYPCMQVRFENIVNTNI